MKIKRIDLDAAEMPEMITVEMNVQEAIAMVRLTGALSGRIAKERGLNYIATGAIFDALTGSVFNRFWVDGVDDAMRAAENDAPR